MIVNKECVFVRCVSKKVNVVTFNRGGEIISMLREFVEKWGCLCDEAFEQQMD